IEGVAASHTGRRCVGCRSAPGRAASGGRRPDRAGPSTARSCGGPQMRVGGAGAHGDGVARYSLQDRKSTRLNSSHTEISTLSLHDALPIFQTALGLQRLDPVVARKCGSVVLERTVMELQGIPCMPLESQPSARREIACTRSFAEPVMALRGLQEAVTDFASRAAEKLRYQKNQACQVLVFVRTSPFRREDGQHSCSVVVSLRQPTSDSAAIVRAALNGLQAIFQPGYPYARAGVMLLDLVAAEQLQQALPLGDELTSEKRTRLMQTIDGINRLYGRNAIHLGSAGLLSQGRGWSMQQQRRTPGYTTRWDDLPVVNA